MNLFSRQLSPREILEQAFPGSRVKDYVYVVDQKHPHVSHVVQVEGHRMHRYTLCGKRRGDTRLRPSSNVCDKCRYGMSYG